jgi:hypothetical protein
MIDPQREPLEGVVEVDQAELPFRAENSFFDPLNDRVAALGDNGSGRSPHTILWPSRTK